MVGEVRRIVRQKIVYVVDGHINVDDRRIGGAGEEVGGNEVGNQHTKTDVDEILSKHSRPYINGGMG